MAAEMETIRWRPSLPDGRFGDEVEVEMRRSDVDEMRRRRDEILAARDGDRTRRIAEIRFQMDLFAMFPGTRIVSTAKTEEPEPEIFARARTTDPITSHEAAWSLSSETLRASQEAVLAAMRSYGFPIDDAKLAEVYSGDPPQSPSGLRTRRAELVDLGLVRDSGETTLLPSGRRAICWEVS